MQDGRISIISRQQGEPQKEAHFQQGFQKDPFGCCMD